MPATGFSRDDAVVAEAVMRHTCPDEATRRFLMEQLLRSIALAERAGPQSWAVTLFEHGFRLNVGQVEVFTYLNRLVRLFMLGAPPAAAYTVGEILECSFKSMPRPQLAFYGNARELQRMLAHFAGPHAAFVQAAAVSASGKPRKCSYARTHSPGLYNYAIGVAGELARARRKRAGTGS
ncbi:MAG TPA: hypothetical protein VM074_10070 [Solimonas sp.]|nr:hypothetical protein [Solimonas sp.]